MGKFFRRIVMAVISFTAVFTGLISANAFAEWKQFGFLGDLNGDKKITIADAVIMTKHLLGETALTYENGYDLKGKFIGINGNDGFIAEKFIETADINQDGRVDVYDMILLRKYVILESGVAVWEWIEDAATTTTAIAETTAPTESVTTSVSSEKFIKPPIYEKISLSYHIPPPLSTNSLRNKNRGTTRKVFAGFSRELFTKSSLEWG